MITQTNFSVNAADLGRLQSDLHQPVIITGMHNSGTSILAKVIHHGGVFLCPDMKHYENRFFSLLVNDQLMMGGEGNWAKLPLMSIDEVLHFEPTIAPFIKRYWMLDYLRCGYDGFSQWGVKDPRICVLLPLYLKIFPNAKYIHIRRNPKDVAASLSGKAKQGIGVIDNVDHWEALTNAYTDRVLTHAPQIPNYFEIEYETFCRDTETVARELFNFLEIPMTAEAQRVLNEVSHEAIGSYQKLESLSPFARMNRFFSLRLYHLRKKAGMMKRRVLKQLSN